MHLYGRLEKSLSGIEAENDRQEVSELAALLTYRSFGEVGTFEKAMRLSVTQSTPWRYSCMIMSLETSSGDLICHSRRLGGFPLVLRLDASTSLWSDRYGVDPIFETAS